MKRDEITQEIHFELFKKALLNVEYDKWWIFVFFKNSLQV